MSRKEKMKTILLTNDDGYFSDGINTLYRALKNLGEVIMVAPELDNSAVSHALSMRKPLRAKKVDDTIYYINGTPADCVMLAIHKLLPKKPDLVVSGINSGPNVGDDISYSGTVSAAMEGTMYSIPSLAFSLAEKGGDYAKATHCAIQIIHTVLHKGLPENTLLNINIPTLNPLEGIKITRQGRRFWSNAIQETTDPWGDTIFWIGGGQPSHDSAADTDVYAVSKNFLSITPIHLDKTNHEGIFHLSEDWSLDALMHSMR